MPDGAAGGRRQVGQAASLPVLAQRSAVRSGEGQHDAALGERSGEVHQPQLGAPHGRGWETTSTETRHPRRPTAAPAAIRSTRAMVPIRLAARTGPRRRGTRAGTPVPGTVWPDGPMGRSARRARAGGRQASADRCSRLCGTSLPGAAEPGAGRRGATTCSTSTARRSPTGQRRRRAAGRTIPATFAVERRRPRRAVRQVLTGHPACARNDATAGSCAARIDQFRPDVVLSSNTPLFAQQILLQRRPPARGARFVFWQQDVYSRRHARASPARKLPVLGGRARAAVRHGWSAAMLADSDHVVVISEDFLPILRRWGIDDDAVTVIENWAPLDELGAPAGRPRLGRGPRPRRPDRAALLRHARAEAQPGAAAGARPLGRRPRRRPGRRHLRGPRRRLAARRRPTAIPRRRWCCCRSSPTRCCPRCWRAPTSSSPSSSPTPACSRCRRRC